MEVSSRTTLVLGLFNVKQQESTPLLYMMAHAFFNGLGIALSFTAINISILENHGVYVLPQLYIAACFLLLIGGVTYSKAEHKLAPGKLFSIALGICTIWALGMRFSLGFTDALLLAGVGFSTYYIVYLLCNLEFWGAAALLFDVRQGKRLFGPLAVGESLAKILGYSLSTLIITQFSLPNVFLVAGFSFAVSWYIFRRLKRRYPAKFAHDHSHGHGHKHHHGSSTHDGKENRRFTFLAISTILNTFRADRFIRSVSLFAMLATLVYFTVHYAFLSQVKYEFKSLKELAAFFGLFLSAAKALNLLIKLLLSSRILNFFGVKAGIFILPISLLIINIVGSASFLNLDVGIHFFIYIFGMNYLIDEAFRSSLHTPSYLILFQPLAKNKRLEGHTVSKGLMEPLGMGLAGVLIIVLKATGQFELKNLTLYLVGFIVVWLLATQQVHLEYLKILSKALKSRTLTRVRYDHSREEISKLRSEKLKSQDPFEIIYATRLLASELDSTELDSAIRQLLEQKDEHILLETLQIIHDNRLLHFADDVKVLINSTSPALVEKASYCFASLKEEDCVTELMSLAEGAPQYRKVAIIGGILKHSGLYGAVSIGEEFLNLLSSEKEDERIQAARIIERIGDPKYYHPLILLLSDESDSVKLAALQASARVANPRLVPHIMDQLDNGKLTSQALNTLERFEHEAISEAEKRASGASLESLKRLIRVGGRIETNESHRFLLPYIRSGNPEIRNEAIYSLFNAHFRANDGSKRIIEEAISADTNLFSSLLNHYKQNSSTDFLEAALYNEMRFILMPRLLYLMSFIYDRKAIVKVLENSQISSGDYRSNALELMENVLRRKHSRRVSKLMEDLFEAGKLSTQKSNDKSHMADAIRFVFDQRKGTISTWLKANCIRAAANYGADIRMVVSDEAQHSSERVMQEEWSNYLVQLK